jgi:hypothetical protein
METARWTARLYRDVPNAGTNASTGSMGMHRGGMLIFCDDPPIAIRLDLYTNNSETGDSGPTTCGMRIYQQLS